MEDYIIDIALEAAWDQGEKARELNITAKEMEAALLAVAPILQAQTLRKYAQKMILPALENPEIPWTKQPAGSARTYALIADIMSAYADMIEEGKISG